MFVHISAEGKEYLKKKDKRLGEVIASIDEPTRSLNPDLFSSLVQCIVGQIISTKAQITINNRLQEKLEEINAQNILAYSREELQSVGLTFKKVDYIVNLANKVDSKELDLRALYEKNDKEVIKDLSSLSGIGVWTAEMLMIFSMGRPDVFSYGDLAIHRGLRMLYRHKKIDRALFEKYRKRFSPYGSIASMYIWEVAGGAIEGFNDPAKIR